MLSIKRNVPKKDQRRNIYGDRNKIKFITPDGTEIEIILCNRKGNEIAVLIDCPKTVVITRKELITGDRGESNVDKRKVQE